MSGRTIRKYYDRTQPSSGGRVYLLWAEGTQIFKIGFTDRTANRRARMIQANSPLPLRVIADMSGSTGVERTFHERLSAFCQHGEWFTLPEAVLWQVLAWFGHPDAKIGAENA